MGRSPSHRWFSCSPWKLIHYMAPETHVARDGAKGNSKLTTDESMKTQHYQVLEIQQGILHAQACALYGIAQGWTLPDYAHSFQLVCT